MHASTFPATLSLGGQGVVLGNNDSLQVGANYYWNGSAFKYLGSGKASRNYHSAGNIVFDTTNTSGSANGTLTFTERMRITSTVLHQFKGELETVNATMVIRFRDASGAFKAGIQAVNSSGQMVGGSAAGDFAIRSQSNMLFSTGGNTERMRIDSSGNLLVNGTVSNPAFSNTANQISLRGSVGTIEASRDGGAALELNRKTSNGSIVNFRKDGSSVGSIGSNSGTNMIMGTGTTGIYFNNAGQSVHPWNITGNQARSGAIDLGRATDRFRNVYINGGVVFGDAGSSGTATSNSLDSYEEGTFTPTLSIGGTTLASTSGSSGRYTKIGRKVYIEGTATRNTAAGASGALLVHGLPFTILNANSIGVMGAGTFWMDQGGASSDTVAHVYAANGNTYFQGVRSTSTGARASTRYAQAQEFGEGRPVYFNFSYVTT